MDGTAQTVADFVWAQRENEVPVEAIERKLKLARYEVVALLQDLATAGHGIFVPGRRSRPSRIVKAAFRPTMPPSPGPVSSQPSHSEHVRSSPDVDASDTSLQVFVLKRETPFRFVVPADITTAEAEKIGKWLELVAEG